MAGYYIPLVATPQIGGGGGGGSGVLVVNVTPVAGTETIRLDKTWQEIHDAMPLVVVSYEQNDGSITASLVEFVSVDGGEYLVSAISNDFLAASPNDYPEGNDK